MPDGRGLKSILMEYARQSVGIDDEILRMLTIDTSQGAFFLHQYMALSSWSLWAGVSFRWITMDVVDGHLIVAVQGLLLPDGDHQPLRAAVPSVPSVSARSRGDDGSIANQLRRRRPRPGDKWHLDYDGVRTALWTLDSSGPSPGRTHPRPAVLCRAGHGCGASVLDGCQSGRPRGGGVSF